MSPTIADRLNYIRKILGESKNSTQQELCESLEKVGYEVNQSTISRDLRKIGAVKIVDQQGRTTYKLTETETEKSIMGQSFISLVRNISHNGSMIVISTSPGSASLVARHLDILRPQGILGTIAGDDTIFIAPFKVSEIKKTMNSIRESLL